MVFAPFIYFLFALAGAVHAAMPGLSARQNTVAVPSSCTSVCTVFSTLQASTDINNLCTTSNSNSLQACANCILLIGGSAIINNDTLISQTQRAVNAFVSACDAASLPVPAIAISDPLTQTTTASAATVTGTGSASRNHANSGFSLRRDTTKSGLGLPAIAGLFGMAISFL